LPTTSIHQDLQKSDRKLITTRVIRPKRVSKRRSVEARSIRNQAYSEYKHSQTFRVRAMLS